MGLRVITPFITYVGPTLYDLYVFFFEVQVSEYIIVAKIAGWGAQVTGAIGCIYCIIRPTQNCC